MRLGDRLSAGLAATHGHLHNKCGTPPCAGFSENVVDVELDGSNAQSQLLSDFLI
jgi:hypothetical protein